MFPYRPAQSTNRTRMLIAAFLAITVHIGLMNFELAQKPISVPVVSLPRSVSIFLRQGGMMPTPDQLLEKKQHSDSAMAQNPVPIEKEFEEPDVQKAPAAVKEPKSSFQPQVKLEKIIKQPVEIKKEQNLPAVEDIVSVPQEQENAGKETKTETGKHQKVQKSITQAESQPVQKQMKATLPESIQLAYPRYQSNAPPAYPGLARKRGQQGTVILQVLVNNEGRVDDLKVDVSSTFALLDRAALSAVGKWNFEPGRRGKERIPMWVRVPVTFKLKK